MKYHGQLNRPSDICCLTASKHHVRALSVSNEATVISRVLRQIIIIQRTRSVRGACLCVCVFTLPLNNSPQWVMRWALVQWLPLSFPCLVRFIRFPLSLLGERGRRASEQPN